MLSKLLWNSLLGAPAVLGAALLSSSAMAQTAPVESTPSVATLDQVMEYSNEGRGAGSLAQVTSITQFSDVSPTDWAYEALSFLANSEELGGLDCLEGYPDGTFRGSRPLTRYEFAAGLAACLDAISGPVNAEQLERIEALQREFAAELATLRGRVDALEAAVGELEENQFSTTTKLRGTAIFSVADVLDGPTAGNNTVLQSRVRLNFDTSFTGSDRLRTRLQFGNFRDFSGVPSGGPGISRTFGSLFPELGSSATAFSYATSTDNSGNDLNVSRLEYYFPVGPATVYVGAVGEGISDIVTTVSPLDDAENGGLSYFSYNPIYDLGPQGAGAGVTFDLTDSIQLGAGYLTDAAFDSSDKNGLFNGGYTAFGQLTFRPGDLTVALTYVNAFNNAETDALGIPTVGSRVFNAYGLSANYRLAEAINIGGWVSYIDSRIFDGPGLGDGRAWTYAGTLGIEDLGIQGSLLGLIVGVPPYNAIYEFAGGGATGSDTSLHIEGFYRIPLNNNISITPGIIWVQDPGNNNNNEDVIVGALRTSFSF
ncbi:iron uptake porin [Leptolyngbya sp. AN02str]|uniref:iron uptake porin n=1 Tax=Leptolyngbya sp. AN02str TaxID=3423363 RepID=UPI003D31E12F